MKLILKFFHFVYFDFQKKVIEFEKQCVWKRRNLVTSLEKEKKSILSILILIAIYTYYKGKKIKIYNLSLQYVQFITSLSRPYIVLDLWWNQSTVKLFITLPRINKNQEKYVTSNFISSFHIFTFIVRFCVRSSNDVDTSTKFLMETRKT